MKASDFPVVVATVIVVAVLEPPAPPNVNPPLNGAAEPVAPPTGGFAALLSCFCPKLKLPTPAVLAGFKPASLVSWTPNLKPPLGSGAGPASGLLAAGLESFEPTLNLNPPAVGGCCCAEDSEDFSLLVNEGAPNLKPPPGGATEATILSLTLLLLAL